MDFFCRILVVFCLLQVFRNPAMGQSIKDTLMLKSVLIEGKKSSRNFNENRSEIDTIAMSNSGTVRLSELISQNTPIFVKEYGRGAMATASFRGTAPSHTKVTWNGLELNSPMLGMVDFSLIPVFFADEVNLLHGASSLTSSSGALGGTIQLENTVNWNNVISGKFLSAFGSYNTFDEYLRVNAGNRKIQSKSSIFYNSSSNDFQYLNKLNASLDPVSGSYIYQTERNRNADFLNYGILQELYLQMKPNQTISLKTWLQHNERSLPQLLTNESGMAANSNRQSENSLRSVLEWKRFGPQSRLSVNSSINLQNSDYVLENSVSGSVNQLVIDSYAQIRSFFNRVDYRYQLNGFLNLVSGFEANFHQVNSENRKAVLENSGYNKSRTENSVYAELEAKINPHLRSVFLLRETLISLKHQALLPLMRFNYQPNTENKLVFSGSIAGNNHSPTLNDLYYLPGGNPNLRPEKGIQTEIGSTDEFSVGQIQFKTGISAFYSGIKDWIIWYPTYQGYWEPMNIEKVESKGVEANVGANGAIGSVRYYFKGNYAFTSTVNQASDSYSFGKQLPYIPKNSANMNVHIIYSRFSFDWMWSYYSKRFTTSVNSQETASDYLYPYFMNNLQIGLTLSVGSKRLIAECKVLNIFNEDYRTVLQRPMPGRNFQILLHYEF